MKLKIDKNIPLPTPIREGKWKGTLTRMEVGDSFLIPKGVFTSSLVNSAKYAGVKVTIRKTHDGYRLWRVK